MVGPAYPIEERRDGSSVKRYRVATNDELFSALAGELLQAFSEVERKIEWLTDNGSVYTAQDTVDQAEAMGFVVCTTPPYSPEFNQAS